MLSCVTRYCTSFLVDRDMVPQDNNSGAGITFRLLGLNVSLLGTANAEHPTHSTVAASSRKGVCGQDNEGRLGFYTSMN